MFGNDRFVGQCGMACVHCNMRLTLPLSLIQTSHRISPSLRLYMYIGRCFLWMTFRY